MKRRKLRKDLLDRDLVSRLQDHLVKLGYLDSTLTWFGRLNPPTEKAWRQFQIANGLHGRYGLLRQTLDIMEEDRCGMRDINVTASRSRVCRWNKRVLSFCFDQGIDEISGFDEFDAVRQAFMTWSRLGVVVFSEVPHGSVTDIRVGWRTVSSSACGFRRGIVAHSEYPPPCNASVESPPHPLHFNSSNYRWDVNGRPDRFDVESVALHEIGHILGLVHTVAQDSVMTNRLRAGAIKRQLGPHDANALIQLYSGGTNA